ncbi:PA14 domain-containing protein [Variovorax rhizosphaerae]|uniref:PA14 domain-containing protein n=1 Tax=Variovorax rhizosphaerae TaxID=1836200 RepID=A0ABU8WRV2_9BURK
MKLRSIGAVAGVAVSVLMTSCGGGDSGSSVGLTSGIPTTSLGGASGGNVETPVAKDAQTEFASKLDSQRELKRKIATPAQAQWSGVTNLPIVPAAASNMPDGKVLFWAAEDRFSFTTGGDRTYSAMFDPVTLASTERLVSETGHNMFCSGTTNLADGRLLIAGGSGDANTSIYNPTTGAWSTAARLNIPRAYNANTLLSDGSVLTLGGSWDGGIGNKHGEVWTAAGGWRTLPGLRIDSMLSPDSGIAAWVSDSHLWLIPAGNGKVFHAGPGQRIHWLDTRGNGNVEVIGPRADDQFSILGNTVMYDTGKVLKVGGTIHNSGAPANKLSYVIDLNAGASVRKINPMAYARAFHNSVVLPNGQVVVLGGQTVATAFSDSNSVLVPELFDPVTETFTPMPAMSVPRNYHSVALLLPDARVLSSGGGLCGNGCAANHGDVQILTPHYLFNDNGTPATRPRLLSSPAQVTYGTTMTVGADSAIAAFSLVRVSSTTHTVNNDQRRLPLTFTALGGNSYRVDVPSNPGWALPGMYMLFGMNADGVPSVARMVTIGDAGAPRLVSPDNQAGAVGSALTLALQTLPAGAAATGYSADGLPPGLSINPSTGVITGTPTQAGNYAVTVYASNAAAKVSSQFLWRIDDAGAGVRFVRLVATSEGNGSNTWASMAEFDLLNADGNVLSRAGWTVSADSADTTTVNGAATQAIDGNPATYWITQNGSALPHSFVVNLGTAQQLGGFRYLPRPSGTGNIAGYAFYVSNDGVNWGNPISQGDLRNYGNLYAQKTVYFNNLAAGKPATQSSTAAGALPARAVDALAEGNMAAGSVTQTNSEAQPWWEVDLGSAYRINTVRLWNRTDCCMDRLANFTLLVSPTPMTGKTLAQLQADATVSKLQVPGASVRLTTLAPGATGRYVRIQLSGTNVLSLAEVEVFGVPAANRAPLLADVTPPVAYQGEQVSLSLAASDPDGDPLTFAITGLPPGVNFNPTSGVIAGFPSQSGNFTVNATVSDGRGGSASKSFAWRILDPVVGIAPIAAPAVAAGGTASYTATGGATGLQYNWEFGDGSPATGFTTAANTSHAYATAGVYTVTVSARNASGTIVTRNFMQAVAGAGAQTGTTATASANVALERRTGASDRLWVVNQDADTVSVFDTANGARVAEIAVGAQPRSVSVSGGVVVVSNKEAATLSVLSTTTLAVVRTVPLPRASQPFGVVMRSDGSTYVALEATGRVLRFNNAWTQAGEAVLPGVRHLALSADGLRLLATRFITAPQPGEGTATVATDIGGVKTGGEVTELNPSTLAVVRRFVLQHSAKADSTLQARGVPNYLGAPAVAPNGLSAWVPSKQDNIQRGSLRDGRPLDFESTVRAISSRLDLATNAEDYAGRVDHDNSSVASAAVYHPNSVYLFVALETSREVAVLDATGKRELFRLATGRAPQGLTLSSDGTRLYAHNFMDRTIGVYDLSRLLQYGESAAALTASWTTAGTERLSATVLRGKQFFYDARDPRLARDAYMSCASCHNDGGQDGRTWDLTSLGEGLRNTIALRGRAGGQGKLHWSGNFDEPHDFEGQIRALSQGTGLMTDAAYNTGTRSQPLGDRKAGVSADLDALAAYMTSLTAFSASPLRNADGTLTTAAVSGKTVFAAQCVTCHGGVDFTDSATGVLNNVGTLKASSGKRLGATLTGLDTPTLRDAWATAPYLHDGSAATVEDAVRAHTTGGTPVTPPPTGTTGTGLLGSYFNNMTLDGTPALTRVEAMDFDWLDGSPAASISADEFSVRWTGMVEALTSGNYQFRTLSDDGIRVWVNGNLVIDNWTPHGPTYNESTAISLVAGQLYSIKVEFYEWVGGATMRLNWKTPGSATYVAIPAARLYSGTTTPTPPTTPGTSPLSEADIVAVSAFVKQIGSDEVRAPDAPGTGPGIGAGLLGSYFNNMTLDGTPALTRVETVDFDWVDGGPGAPIPADSFSVRWTGRVEALTSGNYQFRTLSDDGVRVWVNGTLVIDNWTAHGPTFNESAAISLVAGQLYSIRVEFYEWVGGATMRLNWKTPGAATYVAIPAARLYAN